MTTEATANWPATTSRSRCALALDRHQVVPAGPQSPPSKRIEMQYGLVTGDNHVGFSSSWTEDQGVFIGGGRFEVVEVAPYKFFRQGDRLGG